MKIISLLLLMIIAVRPLWAQRKVELQNLWAKPQVHVLFQGYTVSFTVKDINKSLSLLEETGDSSYRHMPPLDTARDYTIELYPGFQTQYLDPLQPLMQKAVGVFLLLAGHAEIKNKKHKKLTAIIADIQPNHGLREVVVLFSDPKKHKLLFSGVMPVDMYNRDLGID